jgi:hypothetical protein
MNTQCRVTLLTALLGATLLAGSAQSKPRSSVVRFSLAGEKLRVGQADFLKFDPESNYYLVHYGYTWENPAAHLRLFPASDLRNGELEGYGTKVQLATLPRLRTGTGVNIGDTPAQVKRKLGGPPKSPRFDKKTGELTYSYRQRVVINIPASAYIYREPPMAEKSIITRTYSYGASYAFRNGRLRSISYSLVDPTWRGC